MRAQQGEGSRRHVAVIAIALGVVGWSAIEISRPSVDAAPGAARLVSIEHLPYADGDTCVWEPDGDTGAADAEMDGPSLFALFQARSLHAASQAAGSPIELTRPPVRQVFDSAPSYTSVAVDTRTNEVFLVDSNTWHIRIFDRLDNTPPTAARTEPKRVIGGPKAAIQFSSDLYIDPKNGEIYSVENDVGQTFSVHAADATGDVAPIRKLRVPIRTFGLAIDEEHQELFLSTQAPARVAVYRKSASGEDKLLRLLKGDRTRLADAHGIALDVKNRWLFVANWGTRSYSDNGDAPGGEFDAPSITVYPIDADGDTPPVRVIQGPKTQLNWPAKMSFDQDTGELYVANSMGQSILVFRTTDHGDVAPTRVLKGGKTGLSYPLGLTIDAKNKELWAANLGNASATVYPLAANGDVAPLRTIRSAPRGKVGLRFGKSMAVAYDSKREELLVPN